MQYIRKPPLCQPSRYFRQPLCYFKLLYRWQMLGLALNLSDTNTAFQQRTLVKGRARELRHSFFHIQKGFIFRFFIHPPHCSPLCSFKCRQTTLDIRLYVAGTKIILIASRRLKAAADVTVNSNLEVSKNA